MRPTPFTTGEEDMMSSCDIRLVQIHVRVVVLRTDDGHDLFDGTICRRSVNNNARSSSRSFEAADEQALLAAATRLASDVLATRKSAWELTDF